MKIVFTIVREIITVAGDMAPYLLFGFAIAGLLHVLTSESWMKKHLGGTGLLPVLKGVLLGVPLPLCSCGVIGVSASLRKQGASRGAVTGFLIATPQTGVDSILATWGMLGPFLGIFRPLVAFLTGILGGAAVAFSDKKTSPDLRESKKTSQACCSTNQTASKRTIGEAIRYGLVTLPGDIAKPLIVGIVVSGLMGALLPEGLLAPYIGGGVFAMLLMAIIGIPIYVCATASIPLAVGFIHLGASPGAALAFLIAGPATNAATVTTVWKTLGKRTTLIYIGSVALGGILAGLFYDWLARFVPEGLSALGNIQMQHGDGMSWFQMLAASVLLVVLLNSLYGQRLYRYWFGTPITSRLSTEGKDRIELSISGMRCSHCAAAISSELGGIDGVDNVQVDLENGKARINGTLDDPEPLLQAVRTLGYEAHPI